MDLAVRVEEMQDFLSNFIPAPRPRRSFSEINQQELAAFDNSRLRSRHLPCDLQRQILAHLPALKLMELEATCPSIWRPLLRCPAFTERWNQFHGGGGDRHEREKADVWVMRLCRRDEVDIAAQTLNIGYIPAEKKYYLLLPMLLSPFVTSPHDACLLQMKALFENSRLVGSSGPCLVFESRRSNPVTGIKLVVYNTFTGGMKSLPSLCFADYGYGLRLSSQPIVTTDTVAQTFCIILETCWEEMFSTVYSRHDIESSCTLFVYDSAQRDATWASYFMESSCGWNAVSRARRFRRISSMSLDLPDLSEDTLLQLVIRGDFFKYNGRSNELCVWYRAQQVWSSVKVRYADANTECNNLELYANPECNNLELHANPECDNAESNVNPACSNLESDANSKCNNTETKVVKCGGHLLMVKSIVHNKETGFTIWKLRLNERSSMCEWEQISTTPANLMWKSFGSSNPIYSADSSCLCIMALASMEYLPPLVYEVQQDTWYNPPGLMKNVQTLCAMRVRFTLAEHN